jgi:hypothetical protein
MSAGPASQIRMAWVASSGTLWVFFKGLLKNARQMGEKKLAATERKTNNKSVKMKFISRGTVPLKK